MDISLCNRLRCPADKVAKLSAPTNSLSALSFFKDVPAGLCGSRARPGLQHSPIENEIVLVALSKKEIFQQTAQVRIIRPVFEAQIAAVVEIGGKLRGEIFAELLNGSGHLLLHDLLILLLLVICPETLPRQTPAQEVHEDVTDGFKVIPAALFDAQMRVHRNVPRSASQILAFSVRDMLLRLRIAVLLCQPEVNRMDLIGLLAKPDQEIVRLNIAMKEVLCVHILNSIYHLIGKH